jgi:hypothetical protein
MFLFNAVLLTFFTRHLFTEDFITLPLSPVPAPNRDSLPHSFENGTTSTPSPVVNKATKSDTSLLDNAIRVSR